jgi:hypothetical protein
MKSAKKHKPSDLLLKYWIPCSEANSCDAFLTPAFL